MRRLLSVFAFSVLLLAGCNKPEATEVKLNGTFLDIFAQRQNYTCTFLTVDDAGNESSGTIFIDGPGMRMRGDFTVQQPQHALVDAHVIRVGNTNYVWTSQAEQGFQMEVDPGHDSLFGGQEAAEGVGVRENEPIDFTCHSWTPKESLFSPPASIEFIDLQAQMDALQNALPGSSQQDKCASCETIPDATAKAQCKQAFGC